MQDSWENLWKPVYLYDFILFTNKTKNYSVNGYWAEILLNI